MIIIKKMRWWREAKDFGNTLRIAKSSITGLSPLKQQLPGRRVLLQVKNFCDILVKIDVVNTK